MPVAKLPQASKRLDFPGSPQLKLSRERLRTAHGKGQRADCVALLTESPEKLHGDNSFSSESLKDWPRQSEQRMSSFTAPQGYMKSAWRRMQWQRQFSLFWNFNNFNMMEEFFIDLCVSP